MAKAKKDPLFTVFDSTELERDVALIDRVKEKFGVKNDKDICAYLHIHKSVLSEIRGQYAKEQAAKPGRADFGKAKPRLLTPWQRLVAFDHLGYAWARDAAMMLFPEDMREELLRRDNERAMAVIQSDPTKEDDAPPKGAATHGR